MSNKKAIDWRPGLTADIMGGVFPRVFPCESRMFGKVVAQNKNMAKQTIISN